MSKGYRDLAAVLRRRIADGTYPPGSSLPSVADLGHELGLGRDVVLDALADLAGEGLITTRRGFRAIVRAQPERERRELGAGESVVARMPTPAEVDDLELDAGVPVLEVRRGDTVEVLAADRWRIERP